jgi:hypothetical protein
MKRPRPIFRRAAPLPPRHMSIHLVRVFRSKRFMSIARITWKDPIVRADGSALTPAEIAFVNVLMSADNGQNYASAGHAAAGQQSFDQEVTDPGTYMFKLEAVDTQNPPLVSADSIVVSVAIAAPALAAPGQPTDVVATLV